MPRAETSPTVSIADWMDAWSARRPASGPAMPKARKANIELIDNTVERFWAEASRWSSAECGGPLSPCMV